MPEERVGKQCRQYASLRSLILRQRGQKNYLMPLLDRMTEAEQYELYWVMRYHEDDCRRDERNKTKRGTRGPIL